MEIALAILASNDEKKISSACVLISSRCPYLRADRLIQTPTCNQEQVDHDAV